MQVWRICKQKHTNSAFSGIGGLYAQARWTPQGFKVVYTAESLALASLEVFVHTESDRIPLVAIRAFLPEDIAMTVVDVNSLSADWQSMAAYPTLQKIGKQWLQKQDSPVLKVPSSVIPVEFNYLLSPQHPDLQFSLEPPLEFKFDERMWKVKQ